MLLVTGAYAPEISSGGQQCQMVARALAGQVEFHVLTTAIDRCLPRHAVVDGVPVSRIAVSGDPASRVPAAVRMARALVTELRRSDVVHVHGYSQKTILAVAAARSLGVPIVLSLHTARFDEPAVIAGRGRLASWAFNAADRYLTVSRSLTERSLDAGVPPRKVCYVPNGVDVDRFRPAVPGEIAARRRALGIPADRPVVLFVGFFSRDKQPHVIFEAWMRLQREPSMASTLLFVGATRSPYFEVDERLGAEMADAARRSGVGDRLVFVDPTPRIDEYFRAADVFALPSLREGMPLALLEAMASGLPVVASRLAGATDAIVEDGRTGLLVEPQDVDGFAGAVRSLLTDTARASAIGRAARLHVAREFSAARTARGWLDAYETVVRTAA